MEERFHRCPGCGQTLPLTEFRMQKTGGKYYPNRCVPCAQQQRREWWAKNPDKAQAYKKRQKKEATAEQLERKRTSARERQRRRYQENPEALNAYKREWYAANKDKHREYMEHSATKKLEAAILDDKALNA